ncbi:MAG: L-aspartate oxidase [Microcella sp.]|uniref:L-aspartate oxidase n=1 Tax=Microcella sp. TaxID=1913979 RepID=UPI0024C83FE3|nr:L-aspartate oxidase [Microcella sp.]UYN84087.1 MAG: L-aspartate oxidase [Microcella sp.]
MAHILVIGSGMAGLVAALRAARRHDVTIVTKDVLTAGSTAWAQGGIAAAVFPDDSAALHAHDTLLAGAGLSDPAAVEILCTEGPRRVHDLVALGVAFDPAPGAVAPFDDVSDWARGLEAAHSIARILHAGGDATGRVIETALAAAVREGRIRSHEFARAISLIVRDGAIAGAVIESPAGVERVAADAVVLATGGNGRLYRHTTNPPVSTGDGVLLAYAAGAAIADLEFVQFHPTVLAGGGLVSEAVRGEGATLLDADGRRFMPDIDPRAELAPRDIVARAIARQMRKQDGQPVLLDATALGAAVLAERFPTIDALVRATGVDWSVSPVPVTPAAHYAMGGALTDMDGRTTVPGLFAVGETGSTGVHGANRLASNSLLEAVVVGWRAGDAVGAAGTSAARPLPLPPSTIQDNLPDGQLEAPVPVVREIAADALVDGSVAWSADRIRDRAWQALGLERTGHEMADFARELADARPGDDEARSLLPLARLTAAAALARTESRGAHWRDDFPETDPAQRVRRAVERPSADRPELLTPTGDARVGTMEVRA